MRTRGRRIVRPWSLTPCLLTSTQPTKMTLLRTRTMFPIIETTSPTSTGRTSVGTGCSKCPDESTKREKKFEPTFLMSFASTRNDSRRYSFTSYDRFYGLLSDFTYFQRLTGGRTDRLCYFRIRAIQRAESTNGKGVFLFLLTAIYILLHGDGTQFDP